MIVNRSCLLVIVIFATSGLIALAAYTTVFQYAQGQAHGNQGLSKYVITEAQVNNLTAAMNSAFGEPFYVLGNSQDLSSQVLKTS
jgi:sugar phosphate permease